MNDGWFGWVVVEAHNRVSISRQEWEGALFLGILGHSSKREYKITKVGLCLCKCTLLEMHMLGEALMFSRGESLILLQPTGLYLWQHFPMNKVNDANYTEMKAFFHFSVLWFCSFLVFVPLALSRVDWDAWLISNWTFHGPNHFLKSFRLASSNKARETWIFCGTLCLWAKNMWLKKQQRETLFFTVFSNCLYVIENAE